MEVFEAYVEQVLVPMLRLSDIVIKDNLSRHKRFSVKLLIEAAGTAVAFLPPYSPDFNPIEKAFSKLKANLRRIGERAVTGFWDVIGTLVSSPKMPELLRKLVAGSRRRSKTPSCFVSHQR
jgi:transposase